MNFDMEKKSWKERYDRMKAHEGLIDSQVAEICGYASRESLVRSLRSAKVFPLQGMVWIWEKKMGLTDDVLLNKIEVGQILFEECRKYLLKSGLKNLNQDTFPTTFAVSRRTLFNFKRGIWSIEVIGKLPIKIELSFCVKILR